MERLERVLDFWFGSAENDVEVSAEKSALWFGKNNDFDRKIEQRFGTLVSEASSGSLNASVNSPRSRLAVIILLDQFSRNIYRGRPQSFASDPLALQFAQDGLKKADDQKLRPIERVFFYLPFEHSEDLEMQNRSVELFSTLVRDGPDTREKVFSGFLDYAVRHRDIILRFGRFPHRNETLGRTSTAEELAFLTQPGSSF